MAGNLDARLLRYRNDPSSESAAELAESLIEADRPVEAIEVLGRPLTAQPKNGELLVLAGRAWMGRGDLLRAQKVLLQAARVLGDEPSAFRWLGEVLLKRGDPDRASKVLARAVALGAGGPEIDALRDRAERLGRLADSIEDEFEDEMEDAPTIERQLPDDDDDIPLPSAPPRISPAMLSSRPAPPRSAPPSRPAPPPPRSAPPPPPRSNPPSRPAPPPPRSNPPSRPAPPPSKPVSVPPPPPSVPPENPAQKPSRQTKKVELQEAEALESRLKKKGKRSWVKVFLTLTIIGLLGVGGFFGFQAWQAHQAQQLATGLEGALEHAMKGNPADLEAARDAIRVASEGRNDPSIERARWTIEVIDALESGAPLSERANQIGARLGAPFSALSAEEAVSAETLEGVDEAVVLYALGRRALAEGSMDIAQTALDRAREAAPELVPATLARAELHVLNGQDEESENLLAEILREESDHLRARLHRRAPTGELPESSEVESVHDRFWLRRLQALRQFASGERDEARRSLAGLASEAPTSPVFRFELAKLALQLGDLEEAERAARMVVDRAEMASSAKILLAETLLSRGRGEEALSLLGSFSEDDPRILRMRAMAALSSETPDAIATVLERLSAVVEASDGGEDELVALQLRLRLRSAERSTDLLEEARTLSGEVDSNLEVAVALAEATFVFDEEGRREAIDGVNERFPGQGTVLALLGDLQRRAGEDAARQTLEEALERTPGSNAARLSFARLLFEKGELDEADTAFEALTDCEGVSLSLRTYAEEAWMNRAEIRAARGQFDASREALAELGEENAANTNRLDLEARLAISEGRMDDAVAALQPLARAIEERDEVSDSDAETLALYGSALYAAGDVAGARRVYESVLEDRESQPRALLGMAEVMVRSGRYEQAGRYLDTAERALRDTQSSEFAQMLTLRGRIAVENGDDGIARPALRRATGIPGAPAAAWFYLGESLAGDNSPRAREAYEAYLERSPAGPLADRARRAIRN